MKKQYYFTNFGHRLMLDWRRKRRLKLEKLLEQQDKDEWAGKKLDFFAGLILAWVLALVFINHFFSIQNSLYLSVVGPLAFSWLYHRGKVNKQRLISSMKREREQKATCLANLHALLPSETDKLTIQLGNMLGLKDLTVMGEGLPVTGLKDEKKIALYLKCCHPMEPVSLKEIMDYIELTKNQGGIAGVYFTTGYLTADAARYVKSLSNFKVKMVEQDKLVQVLKNMQHPLYLEKLTGKEPDTAQIFAPAVSDKANFLQLVAGRPGMSRKYLFIVVILGLLSLIMSGWIKILYLFLALVNLALAFYTYYCHLPHQEEEMVMIEDLW
ncbi:MAG: hypothetical protein KGZ96_11360 [Clostridia bacterium]|nr:hypothetical protein [Clostridia bacterium]